MKTILMILAASLLVTIIAIDRTESTDGDSAPVASTAPPPDCAVGNINVTNCLKLFPELSVGISITVYTELKLTQVCKNKDDTVSCLIRQNCEEDKSKELTVKWEGVKNAITYLCTEGKAAFINSSACWSDVAVQGKMTKCGTDYNTTAQKQRGADSCGLMKTWVGCLSESTESCNSEAATALFTEFSYKRIEPIAEADGCQLRDVVANGGVVTSFASTSLFNMAAMMVACSILSALTTKQDIFHL